MPPAARVTDMHTCPMVTGAVPHVGGPILPAGCPTVLIGSMPAARIGDMATCVGPPDVIAKGSPTVIIGNMPAARIGDSTAHGGVIVAGCATVLIGEAGMGGVASGAAATMSAARLAAAAFMEMKSDSPVLDPVDVENVSTGGRFGSQGAAMSQARQNGTPFCEICERMRLERLSREKA